MRVALVELVVSSVSSRAVRQARHGQNVVSRRVGLRNDLYCVGWGVKLYTRSLTRDVAIQVEFGLINIDMMLMTMTMWTRDSQRSVAGDKINWTRAAHRTNERLVPVSKHTRLFGYGFGIWPYWRPRLVMAKISIIPTVNNNNGFTKYFELFRSLLLVSGTTYHATSRLHRPCEISGSRLKIHLSAVSFPTSSRAREAICVTVGHFNRFCNVIFLDRNSKVISVCEFADFKRRTRRSNLLVPTLPERWTIFGRPVYLHTQTDPNSRSRLRILNFNYN